MTGSDLTPFFAPDVIAVVGASDRLNSVGGTILANLRAANARRPVYAVNRHHAVIQGQPAYGSICALPRIPQLAVLCTPAETIPDLVTECGENSVRAAIVISAGFRESGPAGRKREAELRSRLREHPQLRVIGPNCLGVVRPAQALNASFSPVLPRSGGITLLTQSGALGTAIMDWSFERDIGFATCVSVGNMVDVSLGELIEFFAGDEQTESLLLYLEGLADAAGFIAAAREFSRRKPIIAFKAGRFEESARAAASHTGALASSDAVYDAAFRRAGVERVHSIEELFDCARVLAGQRRAVGNRLAIVTNAGGPGIMASDAWLAGGGQLAELSDNTKSELHRVLPSCWSHGNPIDVLGDAPVDRFRNAIQLALADEQVDALMVILTPQTMTLADQIAEVVVAAQRSSSKRIVAAWMGGRSVQRGREVLCDGHVPVYAFPEAAAQALQHLVTAGRRFATAVESCQPWSAENLQLPSPDRVASWRAQLAASPGLVDEVLAKRLLAEGGIPIVSTEVASSEEDAVAVANDLGFPVAMKVLSPDISHKTDVGGVLLNLANADQVRTAYVRIKDSVQQRAPAARWHGVTVQPMVTTTRGVELMLGMRRDPQFGPVVLLGAGGITAELQKDFVLELLPLDDRVWRHMLQSLRLFPLLQGYRGRPGVNLAALQDAVLRFTDLMTRFPELESAEINPLLATAEGVIALDARLLASRAISSRPHARSLE